MTIKHRYMNAQTMSPCTEAGRLPKPVCYILVLGFGLQLLHAFLSLGYRPHQQARRMYYMDPAESNLCSGNMHTGNMPF